MGKASPNSRFTPEKVNRRSGITLMPSLMMNFILSATLTVTPLVAGVPVLLMRSALLW